MTSPNDKLKEVENILSLLASNIQYNILQFDKNLSLDTKKKIIDDLDRLISKYDTQNKKAKEVFYIASQDFQTEYKSVLQENTKLYKKFIGDISQRKNIYQILSMRNNSFQAPSLSIDLGEANQHSLDYSKITTVLNDAKLTYEITKQYLIELENDIKEKPVIASDDPAYMSYLQYMKAKKEMNLKQRRNYFKYGILTTIGVVVLVGVLYYIVFLVGGNDGDIIIEEYDM